MYLFSARDSRAVCVILIELYKRFAAAFALCKRRYYKRVQYAYFIVSRFIFPLAVLVHIHLYRVDYRCAEQFSAVLKHKKVVTL